MGSRPIWSVFVPPWALGSDGPSCGPWCRRGHGPRDLAWCELPTRAEVAEAQALTALVAAEAREAPSAYIQERVARAHQRWRCMLAMVPPGPVPESPGRFEPEDFARRENALREAAYRGARERLSALLGWSYA